MEDKAVKGDDAAASPTNQEYLSYYIPQTEWKPTRPIAPIGAMSSSPGPAIVNLNSTIGEKGHDISRPKAPGYKIGLRLEPPASKRFGPGPAAYNVSGMTNQGKENCKAPKMGKAARFREKQVSFSPGPAAYNRDEGDRYIYSRAPAFSMPKGQRTKQKLVTTPAPNAYTLPPVLGAGKTPLVRGPSYSVGKAKRSAYGPTVQSPGPAAYELPSSNVHMSKSPAFSMGTKSYPPAVGTISPGPAAHSSHLVKYDKYSTPRITFGIRHSPHKALPGFAAEK